MEDSCCKEEFYNEGSEEFKRISLPCLLKSIRTDKVAEPFTVRHDSYGSKALHRSCQGSTSFSSPIHAAAVPGREPKPKRPPREPKPIQQGLKRPPREPKLIESKPIQLRLKPPSSQPEPELQQNVTQNNSYRIKLGSLTLLQLELGLARRRLQSQLDWLGLDRLRLSRWPLQSLLDRLGLSRGPLGLGYPSWQRGWARRSWCSLEADSS
ncbi:hypothetical protein M0R45_008082 [Rubus argutus]|uniref:Uncharacterized protein n=1 Tax=Rubus argutus TaxID=59490 RepID=A0AAW1Y239_RUBAR